MKRIALAVLAAIMVTATLAGPAVAKSQRRQTDFCSGKTYLYCTDFTGSTLDTSVWQPNWFGGTTIQRTSPPGGVHTIKDNCEKPNLVTVHDSLLDLEATPVSCTVGTTTYDNSGSLVMSYGGSSQQTSPVTFGPTTGNPVTVKALVQFPYGVSGIGGDTYWKDWGTAWTDTTDTSSQYDWPMGGEIDYGESNGQDTGSGCGSSCLGIPNLCQSVHHDTTVPQDGFDDPTTTCFDNGNTLDKSAWYTVKTVWSTTQVKTYLNSTLEQTVSTSESSFAGNTHGLLFDIACTSPNSMDCQTGHLLVDWVIVTQ